MYSFLFIYLHLQRISHKKEQLNKLPNTNACVRPFARFNDNLIYQRKWTGSTIAWKMHVNISLFSNQEKKDAERSLLMEIKCFYFMLEMTFWIKHIALNFKHIKKTAVGRVGYKELHYFNQTSFYLFLPTFKRKPFLMVVVSEIDCAGWWFRCGIFKNLSVILMVQNS